MGKPHILILIICLVTLTACSKSAATPAPIVQAPTLAPTTAPTAAPTATPRPTDTLIADGNPPECSTDRDQITCTDVGAAGDVDTNHYYIVRAFDAMEQWVDADGVGEFDFGLTSGD